MRSPLFVRKLKLVDHRRLVNILLQPGKSKQKQKARVIIMSCEGKKPQEISQAVNVHSTTIQRWLKAFNERGFASFKPAPRPGRQRKIDIEFITDYIKEQYNMKE